MADGLDELEENVGRRSSKPWGEGPPAATRPTPTTETPEPKQEEPAKPEPKPSKVKASRNGGRRASGKQAKTKEREPRESDEDRLVIYLPSELRMWVHGKRASLIASGENVTTTEMIRRFLWQLKNADG